MQSAWHPLRQKPRGSLCAGHPSGPRFPIRDVGPLSRVLKESASRPKRKVEDGAHSRQAGESGLGAVRTDRAAIWPRSNVCSVLFDTFRAATACTAEKARRPAAVLESSRGTIRPIPGAVQHRSACFPASRNGHRVVATMSEVASEADAFSHSRTGMQVQARSVFAASGYTQPPGLKIFWVSDTI